MYADRSHRPAPSSAAAGSQDSEAESEPEDDDDPDDEDEPEPDGEDVQLADQLRESDALHEPLEYDAGPARDPDPEAESEAASQLDESDVESQWLLHDPLENDPDVESQLWLPLPLPSGRKHETAAAAAEN